jgi:ribosomal protein L11 methyltransferase
LSGLWTVRVRLDAGSMVAAEAALEPFASALSRFEVAGGKCWDVEALVLGKPDRRSIRAALAGLGEPVFIPLPERDWVALSRRKLPAITAGRFYLRGQHVEGPTPRGKIALVIDAGTAFGTGRHETTSGCLIALNRMARQGRRFRQVLDLGCGSGILALAAAKLWKPSVLAADSDKEAVRVARLNLAINGVEEWVAAVRSQGYGAAAIARRSPFDLILANILARPLCRMAPSLARHLAPGGRAVLSGLLQSQEADVLAAHRRGGLNLDFTLRFGDWWVLVLKKPLPRKKARPKAKRRPRGRTHPKSKSLSTRGA